MIKIKGKYKLLKVEPDKFKRIMLLKLQTQGRLALREFLIEALKHVPQYTGTARGTFKPIGRIARYTVNQVAPLGDASKAKQKKYITYGGKRWKTGFSQGGNYTNTNLDVKAEGRNLVWRLDFSMEIPYIAYNDLYPAPPGFILPSNPPWNWWKHGIKGWREYIKKNLHKKLRIRRELIKVKTIRF